MIKTFLLIIILSTTLVYIWFKDGYILGTAEGVLPFYNLTRYKELTSYAWTDHPGLGYISGITVASKPTYQFLSILQENGLPGFIIQGLVFWFVLVSAGMGVWFFTKEFFPNLPHKFLFLSVIFYWFNPISLVNVWNRFLLNYIFFFALLPTVSFLFVKGLNLQKISYVLWITLLCGVYSFTFSYFAFGILLWILFTIITIIFIFRSSNKKAQLFIVKYFLLLFLLFTLSQAWWISQIFNYASTAGYQSTVANFFNTKTNVGILDALSRNVGNLKDIFTLQNASFFTKDALDWVQFFNSSLVLLIQYFFTALIFYSLIKNMKNRSIIILGNLFIITLFLCKGTNPPFGEIYQYLFQSFSFLQVFRNPFEKFGFILSLITSTLIAFSLYETFKNMSKIIQTLIYVLSFGFMIVIWGFPFWTGFVFTSKNEVNNYNDGYKVSVPKYYHEVDAWLKSQGNNFRFIGFPIADEGITYKWDKGYQGADLPTTLFSTPGILFNTAVPYYSDLVNETESDFFWNEHFISNANIINARYFLLRHDVNYQDRGLTNPFFIKERLDSLEKEGEIKKVGVFGNLQLWENLKWNDSYIKAANSFIEVTPSQQPNDLRFITSDNQALLSANSSSMPSSIKKLAVIHPKKTESSKPQQDNYSFNITTKGQYEIVLKSYLNQAEYGEVIKNKDLISINNVLLNPHNPYLKDGWIFFYKLDLAQGEYTFSINKVLTNNQINNAENHTYEILNFNPNFQYSILFDYKTRDNQSLNFEIEQDNDPLQKGSIVPRFKKLLSPSQNLTHYEEVFSPLKTARRSIVSFDSNTNFTIENLQVKKIISLTPILTIQNPNYNTQTLPKISYKKINPTEIDVYVKDASEPFILILSETFNIGWEAKHENGSLLRKHFLTDAYKNGWWVENTGDFKLILAFKPQTWLNLGERISLVTYALILLSLLILMIKKK